MSEPVQVIDVSAWLAVAGEPLGSKRKLWLENPEDGRRWLFKYRHRPETGDDWSERIAADIAETLGIPHAVVELATRSGEPGVTSLDFTENGRRGELRLGNALLVEDDPSYPENDPRRVAQHTVDTVLRALGQEFILLPKEFPATNEIGTAPELFVGYLMLDALISNQDRHHENWGVLEIGRAHV